MIQKPKFLAPAYAEVFQDLSVVQAYAHRPPYPAEVFDILAELPNVEPGSPRYVLDVGCGTGYIARNFVERVDRLDAVDFSQHMLEQGKRLPNGNHPRLRWFYGRVEDVALDPPYSLVIAGESLHWMDWNIVLPRFYHLLTTGGHLAIVHHDIQPDPWSTLGEILPRYSTNKDFQTFDMLEVLEHHGLFLKFAEKLTAPVPFVQSVDDYIESYHARSGFSRERMGPALAEAFDQEARRILLKSHSDGVMRLQVVASVVWGLPQPREVFYTG